MPFISVSVKMCCRWQTRNGLWSLCWKTVPSFLDSALSSRALTLAHRLGLTQVYDSHYLALAEQEGAESDC